MRNGFNIAAISEVINEIQADPNEAVIRFTTCAENIAAGLVRVNVAPIVTGSVRIARDFNLLIPGEAGSGVRRANAVEYFVAGLAGCIIVSYMQGCSVKNVTLSSLRLDIAADAPAPRESAAGSVLSRIRYTADVEIDGPDELVCEIADYVSRFSPNHRTIVEDNRALLYLTVANPAGEIIAREEVQLGQDSPERTTRGRSDARAAEGVDEVRGSLLWQYGTQFSAELQTQGGDARAAVPVWFEIDQPKQYAGIDKAANPQEYLLGAVASEIAAGLELTARSMALGSVDIGLKTSGALDFRGVANLSDTAPVKVHDLRCEIMVKTDATAEQVKRAVLDTIARCTLLSTILRPGTIDVRVRSGGRTLFHKVSHAAGLVEVDPSAMEADGER